ncbi:hypothetical protein [Streptomyces sp. NPDC005955]|uniref:hypothetical protein n=1 Tax=Streptomyces sp. NPDC005955 TaxID=3364738 RepID=UPI00369B27F2
MALYEVDVGANNGPVSVSSRAPFDVPSRAAFPWNAASSAALLPRGSVVYDMDSNGSDGQHEAFTGRDGYVVARHLGKSLRYTPSLVNVGNSRVDIRRGRYRWIAPNTFWFQITIGNGYDSGANVSKDQWRAGVTLPVAANGDGVQVVHGFLSNAQRSGNQPNLLAVTATTHPGSGTLFLHRPSAASVGEGLDGLTAFPARSTFSISGVIEANQFNE